MDRKQIEEAAALLVAARRTAELLDGLPPALQPQTVAEAHAVQDAVTKILGERGGGWKANAPPEGEVQRGLLFARLIFASPARIPVHLALLLGVEAEIAFRFTADLPPRPAAYSRAEVAASVAAFPAIEVVDSRYRDFNARNPLERLADHGLNGAFVAGAEAGDWRGLDLSRLQVTLSIGGRTIVERTGGHPTGDPLGTAHAFVNAMRARGGVHNFAEPGARVVARFEGLGAAEVTFVDG